ncbi:TPA: restriction endonuclease subunit S [Streptococcus suis]|nr:restriction endonuclease subunit S [Streptococcus suis]
MTKEKSTVPRLRFPGFTDAWKQRKLGEVAEMYSGGTPSVGRKDYYTGGIPFIRSAEINSDTTELYLTELGLNNSSAKMVSKGSLLYALYGATSGEVGLSRLDGAINQAILAILPNDDLTTEFLMYWLRREKSTIVEKYLQGGQGNLSAGIVKQLEPTIPTLPEQEAIGNFFSDLDQLITLHQRKLDDVKELKKALLQKMFPKGNGNDFPELRFPEFTDAWKQRKLGEVLKERNESRSPSADVPLVSFTVENGVTPKTERYNREFLVRDENKKYKFTQLDDIVYNPANLKFGAIARNKYGAAVFSPIYVTYGVLSEAHPLFVELIVTSTNFIQRALRYQEGTVYERMAVKSFDLLRSEILLPALPEQEAIGNFFSDLDQLITLHQRQLDHLKLLKKALLQQMFI